MFLSERKLFIGMVSKKYAENDVRGMFQQFGTIEECTVLRDVNGISKGRNVQNVIAHSNVSARISNSLSPFSGALNFPLQESFFDRPFFFYSLATSLDLSLKEERTLASSVFPSVR